MAEFVIVPLLKLFVTRAALEVMEDMAMPMAINVVKNVVCFNLSP